MPSGSRFRWSWPPRSASDRSRVGGTRANRLGLFKPGITSISDGRPRDRDRRASSGRPPPAPRRRRRPARRRSPAPRMRCSRGAASSRQPSGGRGLLVVRLERGLPVGVVRSRPAALAAVALEEAPAGLRVDVEMGVDEPRVHDRHRPRRARGPRATAAAARPPVRPRRSCGPAPRRRRPCRSCGARRA